MSELKATPGPWEPRHDELVAKDGNTVAIFLCCGGQEVNAANARLIAAAPELYEALDEALGLVQALINEGYTGYIDQRERISAALAKARGETQ